LALLVLLFRPVKHGVSALKHGPASATAPSKGTVVIAHYPSTLWSSAYTRLIARRSINASRSCCAAQADWSAPRLAELRHCGVEPAAQVGDRLAARPNRIGVTVAALAASCNAHRHAAVAMLALIITIGAETIERRSVDSGQDDYPELARARPVRRI